tara:strand:- start:13629 stop:13757 length:129 start_codon:yes stop_codon:yes gene_type:complete
MYGGIQLNSDLNITLRFKQSNQKVNFNEKTLHGAGFVIEAAR